MIYVTANINGCAEKYKELLKEIGFSKRDTLFVAGDIVDGGKYGMEILFDMMLCENVIPIFGDHDCIAYEILSKIVAQTKKDYAAPLSKELANKCQRWAESGGEETMHAFARLSDEDKEAVLDYFEEFSLFEEVETGGESFIICHSMPEGFVLGSELSEYSAEEIFSGRCDISREYFPGKILVAASGDTGKILKSESVINIGSNAYDGKLAAVCLETGEEYYV